MASNRISAGCRSLLLSLAVVLPFLGLFGPALLTGRTFAFRDAAHYYHPLFRWSYQEWGAGRIPLWNAQENTGLPVLADATSSVFYPGKLLFLLPLDFVTKYHLYVIGHGLLAAWAAYRLARHWGKSAAAAMLAGQAYSLGGAVLFQYCNVVFLVGAAWLPLAVAAADRLLVERNLHRALITGAIWSVMILGGDPQAAYHAGLLAALLAGLRWREAKRRMRKARTAESVESEAASSPPASGAERRLWPAALWLAAAALAAGVLAAVQILPSAEWSAGSDRALFESPRSIYELPEFWRRPAAARGDGRVVPGLFGVPEDGRHHGHIYQFSVAPWHLGELVWPNFSGRMFPIPRRWTAGLRGEGRIWAPSLYLGLAPLLLALGAWRWRGAPLSVRWAVVAVLAGTFGSLGWYGVGWLVHELRAGWSGAAPEEVWFGQPVGGLYWAMVVLLPGYALFRFPAKCFVVATLGFSLLAAEGLDRMRHSPPARLPRGACGLAVLSALAVAATWWLGPLWAGWLDQVPPDGLFGPLDVPGSLGDLRQAFGHTAVVSGVVSLLLSVRHARFRRYLPALLLGLTALELAIAHHWLIPTAPRHWWQQPGHAAMAIHQHAPPAEADDLPRVHRGTRRRWLPAQWSQSVSPERPEQRVAWEVRTLFPKHHLTRGLELVETYGTFSSSDFATTLRVARRHGWQRPDGSWEPATGVLNALGARYVLLPGDAAYPGGRRIELGDPANVPPNASLWFNPHAFPRAWVVHRIETLPPLTTRSPRTLAQRTREVWFPGGRPRDLRREAVIETCAVAAEALRAGEDEPSYEAEPPATCHVLFRDAQRVDLQVQLARPGLVILNDFYYPGWIATRLDAEGSRERVPILRTNRIFRGVWLPAGRHIVRFQYRPWRFYAGGAISLLGWLVVLFSGIRAVRWVDTRV